MDSDSSDEPAAPGPSSEQLTGCSDRQRFVMELEFMQCLSNPHYLTWLAQNRYLDDPAFKNYLQYLHYWRQPEYSKYLQYPHCLFFLEQLQDADFCKAISRQNIAEFIHTQQFRFWQHYWDHQAPDASSAGPSS